jgi:AraC-like DNA-binding protein
VGREAAPTADRRRQSPAVVVVGWVGALPANLPLRPKRVRVGWLADPPRPDPAVIVLGQEAIRRVQPGQLSLGGRRVRARILLCAEQAPIAAVVAWLRTGTVEVVDPADLAAALATTSGAIRRRPDSAFDAVCTALAVRADLASAGSTGRIDPAAFLAPLPRLRSMSVRRWCAALAMSESTHKRHCRRAWGMHPHAVLDLYVSQVARVLRAAGVASAEIAHSLGYETARALHRVDRRVAEWGSKHAELTVLGTQD